LNIARREAESSERDLLRVAQLGSQRNSRDSRELNKESTKFSMKIDRLREDVATRSAINQLLEDEYRSDVETVLKWTGDVDDYEEDIMSMLKFQLKVVFSYNFRLNLILFESEDSDLRKM